MQTLGSRSVLELGGLVALVTFGLAAVLGAIAVLDADHVASGFGIGFGVAFVVFVAGATVVCALACIARGKAELVALAAVAVTGVALDLLVLAIWRDIDSETYGKVVGIGLVWSFLALLAFGLMLAVSSPGKLTRWPFLGALGAIGAAGLISTYLIATAGGTTVGVGRHDDGRRDSRRLSATTSCCGSSGSRSSSSRRSGSARSPRTASSRRPRAGG